MPLQLFKTMAYLGYAILIFLAICCGYLYTRAEYEATKKFYPNLTFYEYIMLGDKLRINPDGE